MSFVDLERGHGSVRGGGSSRRDITDDVALSTGDKQFTALADRIALQIFRINSNVTGIHKLVDTLGTKRDNAELRQRLHNLTEATKDLVKSSTDDVKQLAAYEVHGDDMVASQRKQKQAKISRDFQSSLLAYQTAAKASAEKQRQHIERARAAIDHNETPYEHTAGEDASVGQQQTQLQRQPDLIADSELQYQEQVIQEREGEIREIEAGIVELNEIFRDLGTIVTEQQSMLDNIESNVISVANDTQGASEELTSAHNYQRKAGRRALCLLLIFIVVLSIVLIAILS
ncbi:t-SNARE [Cystobasidium minutum MCA 4210]|uniref:t-SNARE n=1 Tax=Cystobasidium minutum MCA 4210 TaxID=1397322 RepID=UPI0034CD3C1F|eukprot:jgi/Rhomi1/38819/CE38818_931